MTPKTYSLCALLFLTASVSSQAATVASYNFNDQTLVDSAGFADVVASDITLTPSGFTIASAFTDNANAYEGFTVGGSEAQFGFNSIGDSLTLSFTLSSTTAYELDEISFQFKANSSTTALDRYNVKVFDGTTTFDLGTGSNSSGSYTNPTFSLSSIATLDTVSPLEFIILIDGKSSNNSGSSFFGIDDIKVTTVPEPSTYTLLAGSLALTSVLLRRRRA